MTTITPKKFSLLLIPLILFIFIAVGVVGANFTQTDAPRQIEIKRGNEGQIKIVQPTSPLSQEITPEHVSDKIVTHGYTLINAYIKELTGFTCSFPNGQFDFTLNNGVRIEISPACAYNKIWRQISFLKSNGQSQITFLDGPITGEPGTPNQEAITGAKNTLANDLIESNMMVKKIFKDNMELNLRSGNDFQVFIDLMFNSIKLSKPLASGPIPATATIPEGTLINITHVEDKNPVKIGGISSSLSQVVTNVYFKNDKKEVKIKVDKIKKESLVEIDGKAINTQKGIEIKNSRLHLETSVGSKEIKILPNEVYSKGQEITRIEEVKLTEESQSPVYSVKGTKQAKLLFILPVTLRLETKVNAESGEILSVNKPWWSFLTR